MQASDEKLPRVYLYGGKAGTGWIVQLPDESTVGDGEPRHRVTQGEAVQDAMSVSGLIGPVLVHAPGAAASAVVHDPQAPLQWSLPTHDGEPPGPLAAPWLHRTRLTLRQRASRIRMAIRHPARMVTVYALLDPDGSVRYVGRTFYPKRLQWHLEGRTQPRVCAWVEELERAELSPRARVLVECPEREGRAAEQRFLNIFRKRFALLNTVGRVV